MSQNPLLQYRDRQTSLELEEARKTDAINYYSKYKDSLKRRPCPVCGNSSMRPCPSYAGSFPVAQCAYCQTQYVHMAPDQELLDDYYQNALLVKKLAEFYAFRASLETNPVDDHRVGRALAAIREMKHREVRVLEVACNEGGFLERLIEAAARDDISILAFGIEPYHASRKIACEKGLDVRDMFIGQGNISDLFEEPFDLILSFELLEHLVDPFAYLLDVREVLSPEGQAHFSMPNSLGLENRVTDYNGYRLLAHSIAPPSHLNGFNPQNILHLCLRAGLALNSIDAQGRFDVYAANEYLQHAPKEDIRTPQLEGLDRLDPQVVQSLVNCLNGSSAMYVSMSKPKHCSQ